MLMKLETIYKVWKSVRRRRSSNIFSTRREFLFLFDSFAFRRHFWCMGDLGLLARVGITYAYNAADSFSPAYHCNIKSFSLELLVNILFKQLHHLAPR